MAALSLDLRTRIVSAYDRGEGTREVIAQRFNVSLGMVKSSSSNAAGSATSSLSITAQAAKEPSWPSTASPSANSWPTSPT